MNKKIVGLFFVGLLIAVCNFSFSKSDAWVRQRSIKLTGNGYSCSAVQVRTNKGKDYALTAAHCLVAAVGDYIQGTDEHGDEYKLKIVEEDPASDLLLLEGIAGLEGVSIAETAPRFSHINTFTHGHGMATYKTEGVLVDTTNVKALLKYIETPKDLEECKSKPSKYIVIDDTACVMNVDEEATTALILPGSSGGMVVNQDGELVGIVSAGNGLIGYLVTLGDIRRFLSAY